MTIRTIIKFAAACALILSSAEGRAFAQAGDNARKAGIVWIDLPGGAFVMGSESGREDERPPHPVVLAPFRLAKHEVTVRQYRYCVEDGACGEPDTGGPCTWGKPGMEDVPLVCVKWERAKEFAQWAGGRLPSEAEWEYAARSGGKDWEYPWGNEKPDCGRALIMGCSSKLLAPCSRPSGDTLQGLCDMAGSVWEWVQDWYHPSYRGAPDDGSAWETPIASFFQVMRGGSWMYDGDWARAFTRNDFGTSVKAVDLGFRIARSLTPSAKGGAGGMREGASSGVTALAYSPSGDRILSGDRRGVIKLWNAATGEILSSWQGHPSGIHAVLFTPDGERAVSAGGAKTALWSLPEGRRVRGWEHPGRIEGLVLSPDGKTLAAVYYDAELALWNTADGTPRGRIEDGRLTDTPPGAPGARVEPAVKSDLAVSAAFSPDGKLLAVGQWDGALRLYELEKRTPAPAWTGHERFVSALAFSPEGGSLLSGDAGGAVLLREVATGKTVLRRPGRSGAVHALAFSPDGASALAISDTFRFGSWDVARDEETRSFNANQRNLKTAVFSPDRKRAVSADEDERIKIWNLEDEALARSDIRAGGAPYWDAGPKARLGRTLFFDPRLSGDDSFGCALCHRPEKTFADGRALSIGFTETEYFRNTPTLLNSARQDNLYWDARFAGNDLPSLIRDHMAEAHFMNVDGRMVQERLRQAPGYVDAFREVYKDEPSYSAVLDALAEFVASLDSAVSPYDRFQEGNEDALSPAAKRGLKLFNGKGRCASCHAGPLFTDGKTYARGVPENPDIFARPLKHITFRRFFRLLGVRSYRTLREDIGHGAISGDPADRRSFRTPSLREVARTPPYMHNGVFAVLSDAVRHEGPHLSAREREDLVEFLKALSSPTPYVEEPTLPEYAVRKLKSAPRPPAPPPIDPSKLPAPPPLAPLPPVPVPADNPITEEKVQLGKLLYFDERVSGNGHTACSSCHVPLAGWGDVQDLSRDYTSTVLLRHTQTVLNAAYFSKLNWDGAPTSLEEQAHDAIVSSIVGNGDTVMIEERLAQEPEYVRRFKEVFGAETPHFEDVLKAMAAFMRATAVSKNVPFDNYLKGNRGALSKAERRGMELFKGKANCLRCHNGALLSDQGFHATGVPQSPVFETSPHAQTTIRWIHAGRGVPEEIYRNADSDPGLYLVTKNTRDIGKFRTPSLRELKYTAPYMHNGLFATLEEVVDFYDKGGGPALNKTPLLEPLALSPAEKADLIAFLKALSSAEVIDAPRPDMEGMLNLRWKGCGDVVEKDYLGQQ